MRFASLAVLATSSCLVVSGLIAPAAAVAQTSATLKVMDWNIHHGVDTSNANNLDRVATWIAQINPHVVSLNEVEKKNGYNNNEDEPAELEALLESKTGVAWYGCFAQRTGATTGQGNLILSRIPIELCDRKLLSASRSAARARITMNGAAINVISTHLDDASASTRATQVKELTTWAAGLSEQRIVMGDFNASATASELGPMQSAYEDAWAAAVAKGTAVAYAGNTAGNTRNGRIDYIWRSKGATSLRLEAAQVYNTGSISDHRPLSATYSIVGAVTTQIRPPGNVRIVHR